MKLEDLIYVEGRGEVQIARIYPEDKKPIRGDKILVQGVEREIAGIEQFRTTFSPVYPVTVGLLLKSLPKKNNKIES